MRLIDADKLKIGISEKTKTSSEASRFIDIINEAPTAYDVDAVCEQMDKASDYYEFDEQGKEHVQMVNLTDAFEIVRNRGNQK